jgi:hypothetical protein
MLIHEGCGKKESLELLKFHSGTYLEELTGITKPPAKKEKLTMDVPNIKSGVLTPQPRLSVTYWRSNILERECDQESHVLRKCRF